MILESSRKRPDNSKSQASNWRRDGPPPSRDSRDFRDSRYSNDRRNRETPSGRDTTNENWRSNRPDSVRRGSPSTQRSSQERQDSRQPMRQELESDWRSNARPKTAIEKREQNREFRDSSRQGRTQDSSFNKQQPVSEADKVDSWRTQKSNTEWETSSQHSRQGNNQYHNKRQEGKRPFTANPTKESSNTDSWRRTTDVPLVRPGSARPNRPHVNYSNTKFDAIDSSEGVSSNVSKSNNGIKSCEKEDQVQHQQKQVKMGNAFDVLSLVTISL